MKDEKKYDFFISHASEDKENFVRPLATKLINMGFRVWFDEITLKLGDSLFQGISDGIKNSTYGIIVLSKNFLKKEWTKKELNALMSKEIIKNDNGLILPIWLDITLEEVYEFSPILVDKVAISVNSNEIQNVIEKLIEKTEIYVTTPAMIINKVEFLKTCDENERKKYILDTENRIKNLFYYQEVYFDWYTSEEVEMDKYTELDEELRKIEVMKKYSIPFGVWENLELSSELDMNHLLKLVIKWINRKMNIEEAEELRFLFDHELDIDTSYILFGFPHTSLKSYEVHRILENSIAEVGVKKKNSNIELNNASNKIFMKYYG